MIYLLEDDDNIRSFVVYALNNSGMPAIGYSHPKEFWNAIDTIIPEIVLLDIMLPDEDGLRILKRLRERNETKKLPIILLTAKSSEYDKVIGLDSGADDYIAKPFGTMELISRIKALLRRTKPDDSDIVCGELYISPSKHQIKANGINITLTLKEYEMLLLLVKNSDKVLTRDKLLSEIWGYSFDGESRTVDVHIRTLRSKLGDCGKYIETVRGIGYRFSIKEEQN